MAYVGDGPKPELEVGDISTKDVTATGDVTISDKIIHSGDTNTAIRFAAADTVTVETAGSERVRFDSSGNLLVAHTGSIFNNINATSTVGSSYSSNGEIFACSDESSGVMFLNRKSTDGAIATFRKAGTSVGSIVSQGSSRIAIGTGDTGLIFNQSNESIHAWNIDGNTNRSNTIDLGNSSNTFKDLYLGGGAYIGGTGSTNYLNDYEEGTWTPAITQGWTSVSYTNSYQFGKYTKIGNMVTAWFWIQFSGTSAGNQVNVGGLPFNTPDASTVELAHRGGAVTYFSVPVASAGAITAYTAGGNNVIQFYSYDDSGASAVSNANASSDYLIGSVTYWVE